MMRCTATLLLIALSLSANGCITATVATVSVLYGHMVREGKIVGMNYHADLQVTWDAANAQLKEMGYAPTAQEAKLENKKGRIETEDIEAEIVPLKKAEGTRIEVTTDLSDYVKLQRARAFLNGTAKRLGEYREMVRDFDADLEVTWEAALAQLKEMEIDTGKGTTLEADRGRIRVEDGWAEFERLPGGGTRVHIGVGAASAPHDLERARFALDGIAKRLAQR